MFLGLEFYIPIGNGMPVKLNKQIANQIISHKGVVIENTQSDNIIKVHFVLATKNSNINKINQILQGKVIYDQLLDYKYVQQCLTKHHLLSIDNYILYQGMEQQIIDHQAQQEQIQPNQQDKVKKKIKPNQQKNISHHKNQTSKNIISTKKQYQEQQLFDLVDNKGDKNFSMNKFISDELTKLQKIYANQKDYGRKVAYMRASAAIRSLNKQIQSIDDLNHIAGIGSSIKLKIKQLLQTGHVSKLDSLQKQQKTIVAGQLTKVWGIGPTKAAQLYSNGIKSIQQLRKHTDSLTKNQKIGLKYYQDFQKRIPRQKVKRMFDYIQNVFFKLVGTDNLHHLQVCGSYRRNQPTCGDIDLIITRKDGIFQKNILMDFVAALQSNNFITENLTMPKIPEKQTSMSYMGVCKFQAQIHHRIDIKYYPVDEYAFAILYFTGSDAFNRKMRLYANEKGYSLSDKSIQEIDDEKSKKSSKENKIICLSEKDIFDFLGLKYKTPQQRNL